MAEGALWTQGRCEITQVDQRDSLATGEIVSADLTWRKMAKEFQRLMMHDVLGTVLIAMS